MTNHLRTGSRLLDAIMRPAHHLFDLAAYEFLYSLSPARSNKFFNGGYLPLAPDFRRLPEFKDEQHCAMMYHFVAETHVADLGLHPREVLDVGCGQGGGLFYLSSLFPDAQFTGTDRNGTVVRLARRNNAQRTNVNVTRGSGSELRFPPKSFDLVLSVGAPTYFPLSKYISEAARIVTPGGIISFSAGYRQHEHELVEAEVKQAAMENGLEFVRTQTLRQTLLRRSKQIFRAELSWSSGCLGLSASTATSGQICRGALSTRSMKRAGAPISPSCCKRPRSARLA